MKILNSLKFIVVAVGDIKKDITKNFLKDLENHNRIFNRIKKSDKIFSAINQIDKIPKDKLKYLYSEFKINNTKALLDGLRSYVGDLESKYAILNDSWTLIEGSKRELEDLGYKAVTYKEIVKKCDEIFCRLHNEYERLKKEKRKLMRSGFWKYLKYYSIVYGIISGVIGFLLFDKIKTNIFLSALIWLIVLKITWDWFKKKFWR